MKEVLQLQLFMIFLKGKILASRFARVFSYLNSIQMECS